MANEVTLTFAGDSAKLEKAFDNVGSAASTMDRKVKDSSDALDGSTSRMGSLGERADGAETSLIGVHDVIDGTATIMQGPGEAGLVAYIQGWADLAGGIAPLLLTFLVGRYAMRFDLRLLATVAFVVMGATCFLRSRFYLEVDFTHVAMMQFLMGFGVALFFMPVTVILLSDLDQNEIAAGSGLATFLRTLGGSFAASLTTFLWDRRAVLHHAQLAESLNPYNPLALSAIHQLGHGNAQAGADIINGMIT